VAPPKNLEIIFKVFLFYKYNFKYNKKDMF